MIFKPDKLDTSWVEAMRQCQQNPEYHAEGDVWTHTLLVCSALRALRAYQALSDSLQNMLHAAAILHDCAKPDTFAVEDGRITSKNHSPKGAVKARNILWEMGVPFKLREEVCNLVRFHMRPLYFLDSANAESYVAQISLAIRTDLLYLLAKADTLGRQAKTGNAEAFEKIEMFGEYCREIGCWGVAYPFPSNHARVAHFNLGQDMLSQARPPLTPTVTVMSGLPGSGKDHYVEEHCQELPVISLDEIRDGLDIDPADDQAQVIQQAKAKAKVLLAGKHDFVWNATNVSKMVRNKCLTLFRQYGAGIRVVYVETDYRNLWKQNQERRNPVPEIIVRKLLNKWEVPDLTEAHEIVYAV